MNILCQLLLISHNQGKFLLVCLVLSNVSGCPFIQHHEEQ